MLLQSSVPSSIEAALSFNTNHGKRDLTFEWVNAETRQCCINSNNFSQGGSELLTVNTVPGSNFICKQRKLLKSSVVIFPLKAEVDKIPVFEDKNGPSGTQAEDAIGDGTGTPTVSAENLAGEFHAANASVLHFENFCKHPSSEIKFTNKPDVNLDSKSVSFDCLNDYNQGSAVTNEESFLNDLCISTLRSHGLLESVCPKSSCASTEILGIGGDSGYTQSCKQCGRSDNVLNMLICDRCEEAFHICCCKPGMKMLPIDEWFCYSCSKANCNEGASRFRLGPIAFMLKYPESHRSKVRIGEAFQAKVPNWSDETNDFNCIGEPSEMDPSETIDTDVSLFVKFPEPKSMSNWLQCREVLYDDSRECAKGTICGKWRRAPLSEVQTTDWDCSCAIRWDPSHSDCAVPQEVETEQVLLHLKYIEKLRSCLAAKKRKLESCH
ncbi:uncharacterized protein LOC121243757 [Juglans microcarpa x Juglans regia]|uniref:uncharacterized protein LOC121243757 n=1 Tax=Juglans microcarpa x Juglans regia TaxID=2249226 RepID=UPI001B7EFC5D|nr:uncharacterized protein LOC121243757 [Juglans microcarpa x Juglans regia]XP_040997821.1 uncharacterized protein LOC121243757 [Juglans microcarpa x Juglans regia]